MLFPVWMPVASSRKFLIEFAALCIPGYDVVRDKGIVCISGPEVGIRRTVVALGAVLAPLRKQWFHICGKGDGDIVRDLFHRFFNQLVIITGGAQQQETADP